MESLSDDILGEILKLAVEDNPRPVDLLCCRRFRDIAFRVCPGLPFRYPTEGLKPFVQHFSPNDWDVPNLNRDYFLKRIFANDLAFVERSIAVAPNFVVSCLYFPGKVRYQRRNILAELTECGQVTMFQLLVEKLKIELLSMEAVLWDFVGAALYDGVYSTGYYNLPVPTIKAPKAVEFWQNYTRPCILHNIKHGFYIERSCCVHGGCGANVPDYHRKRTLSAIFKYDDLELFEIYLAQRISSYSYRADQTRKPYSLRGIQELFCIFKPERIIKAHPELFDERQFSQSLTWLRRDDNLEWCLKRGLDLHRVEVLRVALGSKKVQCVEQLLKLYTYNITAQHSRHLKHKIAALGLSPSLLQTARMKKD